MNRGVVRELNTTYLIPGINGQTQYLYDLVGNRITINETVKKSGSGSTTRNLEYDYDAQYRLTSESWYEGNKLKKYDYQYDLAGNRTNMVYTFHNSVTTTTYTHDVLNRLNTTTSAGKTVTYNYDLNGNRISKVGSHPSLPKHYYTFDTLNRLIQTRDGSTNGPVIFQATYDYRTRRLTTTESGATKYFRYDSGDSFHEVANGTSNIQVEFVRGSGIGGGIGSILYSDRGATREHFTYNAVGHTVALTLSSGSVSKSDLYEAYGNIVASTGSSSNNRLANTKERSFTLGLDNHGFRYYDPEVGRYISRDPIGYGDGLNVYLYVHNNPINHIDPLGLKIEVETEYSEYKYWEYKKVTTPGGGSGTVGTERTVRVVTKVDVYDPESGQWRSESRNQNIQNARVSWQAGKRLSEFRSAFNAVNSTPTGKNVIDLAAKDSQVLTIRLWAKEENTLGANRGLRGNKVASNTMQLPDQRVDIFAHELSHAIENLSKKTDPLSLGLAYKSDGDANWDPNGNEQRAVRFENRIVAEHELNAGGKLRIPRTSYPPAVPHPFPKHLRPKGWDDLFKKQQNNGDEMIKKYE